MDIETKGVEGRRKEEVARCFCDSRRFVLSVYVFLRLGSNLSLHVKGLKVPGKTNGPIAGTQMVCTTTNRTTQVHS